MIGGLSRASGGPQIARALLEGIAHRVSDVAEAVWAGTGKPVSLRADGGASRNDLLLQLQADFLGLPVERGAEADGSAFGVARLACQGLSSTSRFWNPRMARAAPIRARDFGDERQACRSTWARRAALACEVDD